MMTLYRIISPVQISSDPHYYTRRMLFPDDLPGSGDKKHIYFVPMFSNGIEIGYFIFQYTKPDGYDVVAIGWINSAVNALNALRMKNDINELLEYNNLSAFRDTATGMYNREGFVRELSNALSKAEKSDMVSAVMLKTRILEDEIRIDEKSSSIKLDIEAAECMRKLSLNKNAIFAKLSDKQFVYTIIGKHNEDYHEKISDRLYSLIYHSPVYKSAKETENILISSMTIAADNAVPEDILRTLSEEITKKTTNASYLRKSQGFNEFKVLYNPFVTEVMNNEINYRG